MMNKKAIAAFAAGATLLAGFAMATPAFAKDETKQPTPAEVLKTAQKAVDDNNKAIADAEAAQKAAEDAETGLAQKVADAKKDLGDTLFAKYFNAAQQGGAITRNTTKCEVADEAKVNALSTALKNQDENATKLAKAKQDLATAKAKVYDLAEALKKAQAAADAASDLEKSFHTKEYHIARVSGAKTKLDATKADHADKMKTYSEKFEAWQKADADLKMATANFKAAQKAVSDAEAAGLDLSDKTAYKALKDTEARAQAELDAATTAEQKAARELEKAKGEAEKAAVAYNKALEAYKAAYNAAIRDGVKLPADLPQITDPLVPTTLPGVGGFVPDGQPGQPGQPGKPGKPGKPEVEKK
ncbi:hypothetical protein, partial [Gardnerella vaginalis]